MDTNKLKRFATEARNKIRQGVVNKLLTLGFNASGEADEFPRQLQGSTLFRGQQLEESFHDKWIALYEAIQKHGLKEVYEEVTYTWFNRFMAIRILQMNGFIDRVLIFDNPEIRVPHIVTEARQGRFPAMSAGDMLRLRNVITDPTKTYEQFVILVTAFCHATPILNRCFGAINDYTELLLPNDILDEGGFVDMLNHTEFISEDDYKTTELLGWLYQFYISERKDEVFASFKKGKKAEADDIAPATQIFTPNWIVKYMVENTLGRVYLDNNPDSALRERMAYLVDKADGDEDAIYRYDQLEELRVIDPACGSGHILLEAFELLYSMYIDEFYSREEAISAIFEHNLVGIDLDTRARQLATFALLLKACQRDDCFLDAHSMPRVLDMSNLLPSYHANLSEYIPSFIRTKNMTAVDEILDSFELMKQAGSLGSTMRFAISDDTRRLLVDGLAHWKETDNAEMRELFPAVRLILALTEKYTAVIANPPYMGAGNMNAVLSEYVKKNYVDSKSDLFSVFMTIAENLLAEKGKYGMINLPSWLFLSSFENLRKNLIKNCQIDSLLHMGRGIFGIDWGSVAFIISKHAPCFNGTFFRLHERTFQHMYYNHIGQLFKLVLNNHSFKYDFSTYRDEDVSNIIDFDFKYAKNGLKLYFETDQKNFEKIPGSPVGYWVSPKIQEIFASNLALSAVASPCVGLQTADNARFLRLWFEVCQSRIGFGFKNAALAARSQKKWFPYNKGGSQRRWYGNQEYLVNWKNDGEEIKSYKGAVVRNPAYYFMPSISWGLIASLGSSFRYYPQGFIYDVAGMSLFANLDEDSLYLLGVLNTKLFSKLVKVINPTINMQCGDVARAPYLNISDLHDSIKQIAKQNISISKLDWDAHETSWDFQRNELLTIDAETYADNIQYQIEKHEKETGEHICVDPAAPELGSLAWRMEQYKLKWEKLFMRLHANEEELNRQFIDIYGLQDELTPDVPLDEVTILQQGEISFIPAPGSSSGEPLSIEWNDAVLIKQFISYAIGCMMGRYSLDKSGLILANQGDTLKEYLEQVPSPGFMPDEDGILPLMDENSPFSDNVVTRMAEWVKVALGSEWQTANLNQMETALGKSLADYIAKDFWKDHKKMYQNRPIYWLFSSKKGAFKALVYMHRMDPYTVGKVRNKYLLPYIEWLKARIDAQMARQAELSAIERRQMQNFQKQLEECREYDVRLHEAATNPMNMDLDDGIVINYAKYGDILAKLK